MPIWMQVMLIAYTAWSIIKPRIIKQGEYYYIRFLLIMFASNRNPAAHSYWRWENDKGKVRFESYNAAYEKMPYFGWFDRFLCARKKAIYNWLKADC